MKALIVCFLLSILALLCNAQLAVDGDGKLFVMYQNQWRQFYCDQFSKAAYGNGTLWAVYNGLVKRQIGTGRPFHLTLGNLTSVEVACDGSAWGIWQDNKVYSWNDKFETWDLFCGNLKDISVGANSSMLYGVDIAGNLVKSDGFGKWDQVPNTPDTVFNRVSVGCDNTLYAVAEDGTLWRLLPTSSNWEAVQGPKFYTISVGDNFSDVWGITMDNSLVVHLKTEGPQTGRPTSSPVETAAPTATPTAAPTATPTASPGNNTATPSAPGGGRRTIAQATSGMVLGNFEQVFIPSTSKFVYVSAFKNPAPGEEPARLG